MVKEIIIILFVCAALIAALCLYAARRGKRCGYAETLMREHEPEPSRPQGGFVGLANPMRAVESVGDINSAVGCSIHAPEGAEEEQFFVFSTTPPLGDYRFTVGGKRYCLRASRTEDDISGVYVSNGTLTDAIAGKRETEPVMIEGNCFARFFRGDMQYALTSSDAELGEFGRTAKSLANDI